MIEELGLLAPLWTPLQHSTLSLHFAQLRACTVEVDRTHQHTGLAVFLSFLTGGFLLLVPALYEVYYYAHRQAALSNEVYWQTIVRIHHRCYLTHRRL